MRHSRQCSEKGKAKIKYEVVFPALEAWCDGHTNRALRHSKTSGVVPVCGVLFPEQSKIRGSATLVRLEKRAVQFRSTLDAKLLMLSRFSCC